MMWGYNYGMGWMWAIGLLLLLLTIAVTVLIVRSFASDHTSSGAYGPVQGSRARNILDERLAQGEITPDEYRAIVRTLNESDRRDEERPRA